MEAEAFGMKLMQPVCCKDCRRGSYCNGIFIHEYFMHKDTKNSPGRISGFYPTGEISGNTITGRI